mmetsp:Transcript_19943/g.29851  ORF Transcript_19943/g.29851 Transcript_19943/m.29851 type:complete len:343 (+) Transcript_19943:85-1113(+)
MKRLAPIAAAGILYVVYKYITRKKEGPVILMISGDRSQVGKSSVCLGILGSILRKKLALPSEIGYIKPSTQCEKPTLISKFCVSNSIHSVPIGPVVYFKGMTRSFIDGQYKTASEMLSEIKEKVSKLSKGKKFVIVDGVGYPSVGSVTLTSNAHVAKKLGIPVILVGKRGTGDAIDSTNINVAYFEHNGVKVLGSIFNKIVQSKYTNLDTMKKYVGGYFSKFVPHHKVYGYIPQIDSLIKANPKPEVSEKKEETKAERPPKASDPIGLSENEGKIADTLIEIFSKNVNLESLLQDAAGFLNVEMGTVTKESTIKEEKATTTAKKRTREEIEKEAKENGACGG